MKWKCHVCLQIGLVSQEPLLFAGSILDNIRYGRPDATQTEVEAAARSANAHDFISALPEGYDTKVSSMDSFGLMALTTSQGGVHFRCFCHAALLPHAHVWC